MILGIVVIAASLRFCFPGRLAVEHFDEGVYASNIWFGDRPGGVYPEQHLYAPPMLPALIEWGFVFFGPSNAMAIWPCQLAGTVTVILLWWLGRSWFGPVAGLTAAALCATSEVHIILSRSALTDALLGMWWLASLFALHRACDSGRWSPSLLAGYLVGMAWYTKYNGWMPLAITFAAVVARGVICRGSWPQTRRALKSCLIAGVMAFITWSPWLWSLQSKGGYASVLANHRQYVVGIEGWWPSFVRQWEQLTALTGSLSLMSLIGSYFVLTWLARPRMGRILLPGEVGREIDPTTPAGLSLVQLYRVLAFRISFCWMIWAFISPILVYAVLTVQTLALWWWLLSRCEVRASRHSRRDDLEHWILLAWFCGMFVATPLYRPYLRLELPWLMAAMLGIGLTFQRCWEVTDSDSPTLEIAPRISRSLRLNQIALIVFAIFTAGTPIWCNWNLSALFPIADRSSLAKSAGQIATAIREQPAHPDGQPTSFAVYVYAEPGLLFQLRNAGLLNVGPVGTLQFMDRQVSTADLTVYLAVGVHAKADPRFLEQFAMHRKQLKRVGSWPWQLGPLVALDQPQCDPHKLGLNPVESATIELYEVGAP